MTSYNNCWFYTLVHPCQSRSTRNTPVYGSSEKLGAYEKLNEVEASLWKVISAGTIGGKMHLLAVHVALPYPLGGALYASTFIMSISTLSTIYMCPGEPELLASMD